MVSMPKPVAGLAILLAALAWPAAAQQSAGRLYCCNGGRICADSLPEQCRGKAYRILDDRGNVIKEVGPPLTVEQKAEIAAEEKRRREVEEKLREQRRRDQALLDTYATLDDIDMAQRKAEADINLAIRDTEGKIEAAKKRRKKFEDEAEFYKKKALPPEVAKGLGETEHEIRTLQDLLAVKKGDLQTINAKYDGDRKRYVELTGARPSAGAPKR